MHFNYKNTVLTLFFLIFFKISFNQTFSGGIGIGYGMYQLDELKQFQTNLKNSVDITNLSSVESFPAYIFYKAHLNYTPEKKMNSFGFEFNNYMTGARNHAADYSGEYKLDIHLNAYKFGVSYKLYVEKIGPVVCFAQIGTGGIFNIMELIEELTIYDEEIFTESMSLKGIGVYFEPKIIFSVPVSKKLNLNLNVSYEYDFNNKLHLKDDKDQILYLGYQNPASVRWNGLKFSLNVSYVFSEKTKL